MRKNWVWILLGSVGLLFAGVILFIAVELVSGRPKPSGPTGPPPAAVPVARERPVASPPAVKAEPPEKRETAPSPDAEFRAAIADLGLSLNERRGLFRQIVEAESRTMWEANRLYRPIDQFREIQDYISEYNKKYKSELYARAGLTEKQAALIVREAFADKWPFPDYPGIDVREVAKGLDLTVYLNRGETSYHRRDCPLLGRDKTIEAMPLENVVDNPRYRPCVACQP